MNCANLMTRARSWLGRTALLHAHLHPSFGAYLFDHADGETGSRSIFSRRRDAEHHLIRQYTDRFEVEKEWRWSGTHYQRTALDCSAISTPPRRDRGHPSQRLRRRQPPCDAALALVSSSPHPAVSATPTAANGRQPLPDEAAG